MGGAWAYFRQTASCDAPESELAAVWRRPRGSACALGWWPWLPTRVWALATDWAPSWSSRLAGPAAGWGPESVGPPASWPPSEASGGSRPGRRGGATWWSCSRTGRTGRGAWRRETGPCRGGWSRDGGTGRGRGFDSAGRCYDESVPRAGRGPPSSSAALLGGPARPGEPADIRLRKVSTFLSFFLFYMFLLCLLLEITQSNFLPVTIFLSFKNDKTKYKLLGYFFSKNS